MNSERQGFAFPNLVAALGGCSRVEYSAVYAWVYMPGQSKPVRLLKSQLPPVTEWTAFNLADAVAKLG